MSAEIVIATLAKTLSGSLVKAAGRRIRKELEDPERSRASPSRRVVACP